ncbi:MAG: hypothetical protein ACUZ8N_14905 [Candidatus Scalindua sp.]|nr:hypothetical protein [Patescibacteria group bacterium]
MKSKKQIILFDEDWFSNASSRKVGKEWVDEVVNQINGSGGIYLSTLRLWFDRFPLSNKHKKHLKQALESFNNYDHLGAVNELAWWQFINSFGWSASPIKAGNYKRPDFHIIEPIEFFCEVTTSNLSEKEKKLIESGEGAPLNHNVTIERFLRVVEEKVEQIKYGASKKKPSVLILFDYTTWSGFGTQLYRELANILLGNIIGFSKLPSELSAIVYVERKVLPEGNIVFSKDRSAVYHNPNALFKLPISVFQMMRQFLLHVEELQATLDQNKSVNWFWL